YRKSERGQNGSTRFPKNQKPHPVAYAATKVGHPLDLSLRSGRGPFVDEIVGIDCADAGCKIPSSSGAVRRFVRRIGRRKNALRAGRNVAIHASVAIHVHVAQSYVIENAITAGGI